jgi:D-3-phosphoglycerate dehydrogenase
MDILISEDLDGPAIQALGTKFSVVRQTLLWKNPVELERILPEARAIVVRNQTQVTAKILEAARNLVVIGRVGVGLDNIDVSAATARGIVVVAPLNANAVSVAELALGLLLALARKIPFADRSTKAGGWDRKTCTGIEVAGRTLGICGFGRIGQMVAARARALGLQLLAFDPYMRADAKVFAETGAVYCESLPAMVARADFVTVHLPLTAETKNLFDQAMFSAMKPGCYFINTSRGGVVDETALVRALAAGAIAGAALDVRGSEPPAKGALETMDNVILTPHIGAFTAEAQRRTLEAVCEDIARLLQGEAALNYVNIPQPNRTVATSAPNP